MICGTTEGVEADCFGECVPPPIDGHLCWWAEGDVSCPSFGTGYLGSREVIYTQDAIDTRDCSACECADPEVDCSEPGVVMVSANQSCDLGDFPAPVGVSPDDCMQYAPHSVLMNGSSEATTSCGVAEASVPTGMAQPQGAVTICCEA
jgi:hypothetical protein